jgi:hypothetical protein
LGIDDLQRCRNKDKTKIGPTQWENGFEIDAEFNLKPTTYKLLPFMDGKQTT